MARRKPRLWPKRGIPSDPGGTLFDDLLPLVRRRKMGTRKRKIANIDCYYYYYYFFFVALVYLSERGCGGFKRLVSGR
jgi:hypothetical protein